MEDEYYEVNDIDDTILICPCCGSPDIDNRGRCRRCGYCLSCTL
ncbi:MAG: hypothetical protein ACTSWG_02460 [Candidatus Helarchaeota archaeon]